MQQAYCEFCHVHDQPFHKGPLAQIFHHHLLDAHLAEINICYCLAAGVIPACRLYRSEVCRRRIYASGCVMNIRVCEKSRQTYIWAESSEFPQPSISICLLGLAQAPQTRGCNCVHSPYHSKAFCLRFWKNPSQKVTERNSSKSSGTSPSKVMSRSNSDPGRKPRA